MTSILSNSIYMEKDIELLVDVDINLMLTRGGISWIYSIRYVLDIYIKMIFTSVPIHQNKK